MSGLRRVRTRLLLALQTFPAYLRAVKCIQLHRQPESVTVQPTYLALEVKRRGIRVRSLRPQRVR